MRPDDFCGRVSVDVARQRDGGAKVCLDAPWPSAEAWSVADVQRLRLLALAYWIVHLALDDGIVVLARHVMDDQLRGVVAAHELLVHEPAVREVERIGVGLAGQPHVGALGQASRRPRAAHHSQRHLGSVLHLQTQTRRLVRALRRVLRLARERRVVVLLLRRQLQDGLGCEATPVRERLHDVLDAVV